MIGMIVNFVVTWVVTLVTKAPPKEVQDLVGNLRYPKEAEHPAVVAMPKAAAR
jgi:cation/acetate symporter